MFKVYFGVSNAELQVFGCKGNEFEKNKHESQCSISFFSINLDAMFLRVSPKSSEIKI